jgi:hypothetical protein
MPSGVAIRVTFRHNKGHRNPHSENYTERNALRTFVLVTIHEQTACEAYTDFVHQPLAIYRLKLSDSNSIYPLSS